MPNRGVPGMTFFTEQTSWERRLYEESLTGQPTATPSAIESRPMP